MGYLDKSNLRLLWAQINNRLFSKVDAVDGKGLSSNDYTDEDKEKVGSIDSFASDLQATVSYNTQTPSEEEKTRARVNLEVDYATDDEITAMMIDIGIIESATTPAVCGTAVAGKTICGEV